MATTKPVPNLFTSLALKKAEIVVPIEIVKETTLAKDSGRLSSAHMAGSAVPKVESGNPKPIYRIKITVKNKVVIDDILAYTP